jgi:hypothetical protein
MGIRKSRLTVILVLVAASLLLALPGAADAHVKAKYRAEYARQLASFESVFKTFAIKYDKLKDHSMKLAETLAPMVGVPEQHDQLVDGENYALFIYANHEQPRQAFRALEPKFEAFGQKASRYFASVRNQRQFKKTVRGLRGSFGDLLVAAYYYAYVSFQALGMDPPALELSASNIAEGDENAATAHERFDATLAALRKLL